MNNAPIGIFDSGVGGLSVYLHLQKLLPCESFLYFADTQNVPYGTKTPEHIIDLSLSAAQWLTNHGAKLLVVACNSASAHALPALRKRFAVPIVGLVPAIKPATLHTQTRQIALLATQATLNGALLKEVIDAHATPFGIKVHSHFEPCLVPWVENGLDPDDPVWARLCGQVHAWCHMGVDTLVLGCTHYPFFRPLLKAYLDKQGLDLALMDSGMAVALRTQSVLAQHSLQSMGSTKPLVIYDTAKNPKTQPTIARLLGSVPFLCQQSLA